MTRQRSVAEIADYVGGTLVGDGLRIITGVSTPDQADDNDVVFIDTVRHIDRVAKAGVVLVPVDLPLPTGLTAIRVSDPATAMARVVDWLFPVRRTFEGVSPAAFVSTSATLGRDVAVGPLAYIGDDVRIGDRTEVHPASTVGRAARIGADCVIHCGVHIYGDMVIGDRVILHSGVVIGADGFGYTREPARSTDADPDQPLHYKKTRHVGIVIIGDDVEVGANTTIDRATFTATRVGQGSKIDNLVTIGHNSALGRHCIVIGQAGISGSTVLGDGVTVAGQAGLAGHLTIGSGAVIGAQSGVTKDIKPGQVVLGSPAVEARRAKKALTLIDSLPEFKRTLAAHERRLAEIERGPR